MSHIYTITLTDAEDKALRAVAVDPQQWIDNAIHERCRVSIESIVAQEVQRKLSAGESISGSKEDIVLAAQIKSAAELEAESQAKLAEKQAAQQENQPAA
jgi:hypothetical protein